MSQRVTQLSITMHIHLLSWLPLHLMYSHIMHTTSTIPPTSSTSITADGTAHVMILCAVKLATMIITRNVYYCSANLHVKVSLWLQLQHQVNILSLQLIYLSLHYATYFQRCCKFHSMLAQEQALHGHGLLGHTQ